MKPPAWRRCQNIWVRRVVVLCERSDTTFPHREWSESFCDLVCNDFNPGAVWMTTEKDVEVKMCAA